GIGVARETGVRRQIRKEGHAFSSSERHELRGRPPFPRLVSPPRRGLRECHAGPLERVVRGPSPWSATVPASGTDRARPGRPRHCPAPARPVKRNPPRLRSAAGGTTAGGGRTGSFPEQSGQVLKDPDLVDVAALRRQEGRDFLEFGQGHEPNVAGKQVVYGQLLCEHWSPLRAGTDTGVAARRVGLRGRQAAYRRRKAEEDSTNRGACVLRRRPDA